MSIARERRDVSESALGRGHALAVATGVTVVAALTSAVTGVTGVVVGAVLGASDPEAAAPLVAAMLLVSSEVGYVLTGYVFRFRYGMGVSISWAGDGLTARDGGLVAVATAGLVALNRGAFAVAEAVDAVSVPQVSTPPPISPELFAVLVPVLLLAVGPAEEYLFRGVIQQYLGRAFSTRVAVGVASTLFALIHLPNLLSHPAAAPVSIPLWVASGVTFGWLYARTERLLVPAAAHGLYNVAVVAWLFV